MKIFGKCKGGGRRSAPRETAPFVAVLTTLTRLHGAILVDLSSTGARLRGADLPKANEELVLTVERIRAFATVAWSENGECGIEFDPPLRREEIQKLREDLALAPGLEPDLRAAVEQWTLGIAR